MSRREIVARLAAAQKSNRGAGAYSRLVNRPLGRQIASFAVIAGLGPNQVSLISAVFSYAGIALIALVRPGVVMGIAIALLLIVGYAFDSADGQVARVTGRGSVAGEWLDHVIDAAKIVALHCTIAVCWYRFYDIGRGFLLVPLGYAVVASVFFFAIVLADMLRRIARVEAGGSAVTTASVSPQEAAPWLRSLVALPYDYGVLCIAVAFLGVHRPFVVIYTVLFAGNVLSLVAGCVRWFREMRTL
jgi:phosphatidylglycerophosphate synthase